MADRQKQKDRLALALQEFEAAMSDMFGPRCDTHASEEIDPSPVAFALAIQMELMIALGANSMTINKASVIQLELDRAGVTT